MAKGKYIFNLDADDFFYPDKIKRFVDLFEADPTLTHIANLVAFVDEYGTVNGKENIPAFLLDKKNQGLKVLFYFYNKQILFGGGSSFACRASAVNPSNISADCDMFIDELLVLMAMSAGYTYFISEPLSVWRLHGANYTVKKAKTNNKALRMINSCKGLTKFTANHSAFDYRFKQLFNLNNQSRILQLKESIGRKKISDILSFFIKMAFFNKYFYSKFIRFKLYKRFVPNTIITTLLKHE